MAFWTFVALVFAAQFFFLPVRGAATLRPLPLSRRGGGVQSRGGHAFPSSRNGALSPKFVGRSNSATPSQHFFEFHVVHMLTTISRKPPSLARAPSSTLGCLTS